MNVIQKKKRQRSQSRSQTENRISKTTTLSLILTPSGDLEWWSMTNTTGQTGNLRKGRSDKLLENYSS